MNGINFRAIYDYKEEYEMIDAYWDSKFGEDERYKKLEKKVFDEHVSQKEKEEYKFLKISDLNNYEFDSPKEEIKFSLFTPKQKEDRFMELDDIILGAKISIPYDKEWDKLHEIYDTKKQKYLDDLERKWIMKLSMGQTLWKNLY